MGALDTLLEQALRLPDEERGTLAARLLRTLEPDDGGEVTGADCEAAWSTEIDKRVREVDEGTELLDGDAVLSEARDRLASQRR